jgi:hypothetical protein
MGPSSDSGPLVQVVREVTAKYKDVRVAEADGYGLLFGCVTGADFGAMGMHFVNGALAFDGELDARTPEIILYEPQPNGSLRLTGADYLVLKKDWDAKHPGEQPQIMGQLLQFFDAPNRFGLEPFYTLHVWAWKDNPVGTFTNWNPNVKCDPFKGQN